MKKYLIVLACALTIVGCKQKQEQAVEAAAVSDSEQVVEESKVFTPAEIGSQWTTKDINVEKGGAQPDIVTLLRAFGKVWPTESLNALLEMAAQKVDQYINRDTGGGMDIDNKNGYASVQPGDTDEDRLFAAVWKRSNGHRLFGIRLFTPSSDNRSKADGEALCFYDYDPKAEKMTPEKDVAVAKFQPAKDHYAQYEFPRMGRDMLVGETNSEYISKWHVYAWDGMNFKEETAYTDEEMRSAVAGLWLNADKNLPFTFRVFLDEEEWPQITECGISGSTEYDALIYVSDGQLVVMENNPMDYDDSGDEEMENNFKPSLVCRYRLTKDGKLTGAYYIKKPDNKELSGIMTLEKQSQLNDYAE